MADKMEMLQLPGANKIIGVNHCFCTVISVMYVVVTVKGGAIDIDMEGHSTVRLEFNDREKLNNDCSCTYAGCNQVVETFGRSKTFRTVFLV